MLLQKYILSIAKAHVRKLSCVFICIYYNILLFCRGCFSETKTISLNMSRNSVLINKLLDN